VTSRSSCEGRSREFCVRLSECLDFWA
jgi:hypothetical protein